MCKDDVNTKTENSDNGDTQELDDNLDQFMTDEEFQRQSAEILAQWKATGLMSEADEQKMDAFGISVFSEEELRQYKESQEKIRRNRTRKSSLE